MILVDTSIWVRADRDKTSREALELDRLIDLDEVATTGMVLAEVLQGIRAESRFRRAAFDFTALHYLEADRATWLRAGELSYSLIRRGMTTPLSDLVIARVALENNVSVYTTDDHFSRVEGLQLYVPT